MGGVRGVFQARSRVVSIGICSTCVLKQHRAHKTKVLGGLASQVERDDMAEVVSKHLTVVEDFYLEKKHEFGSSAVANVGLSWSVGALVLCLVYVTKGCVPDPLPPRE